MGTPGLWIAFVVGTEVGGYSDTLGDWQKCHCNPVTNCHSLCRLTKENQGIQIYEFQLCCMSRRALSSPVSSSKGFSERSDRDWSFLDTIKAPYEEICALPEWFKENGGSYRRGKSGYTLIRKPLLPTLLLWHPRHPWDGQ